MKKKHLLFLVLLTLLGSLSSCRKDVDMNNIDPRIQAQMGMALPIGNIFYSANDFLHGENMQEIYVDERGVFHFMDTLDMPVKEFHKVNLSDYIGNKSEDFGVFDQLKEQGIITEGGTVIGFGKPICLTFHMTLKMDGMNGELDNERLDSVQVINSLFASTIQTKDFDLDWEWVDKVDVVLNKQFRRPKGDTVRLYSKGDGYGFGEVIPVHIDEFAVSMMKDKSKAPGKDNVTDQCDFTFLFHFTIPTGSISNINSGAAFNYSFMAQFIDFEAAWGFFEASNLMRDESLVCIDSMWNGWKNMKKMKMRFMEPSIDVHFCHKVAVPLRMKIDYLNGENATEGTTAQATWNGKTDNQFLLDNTLSPYSNLGDSVWNSYQVDYTEEGGRIDRLFDIRPDSLKYSYYLTLADNHPAFPWKQQRVTPHTEITGYAITDMPFVLNTGSSMEFVTKMENIEFNRLSLDSILNTKTIEKGKANHIQLYMMLTNNMPFEIKTKIYFLREDSSIANIQLIKDKKENEFVLPAPKMNINAGEHYGYVVAPSETVVIMDLEHEQFDELVKCKHLKIDAALGNNPQPCAIDISSNIMVRVGVAADVEAILNLSKKEQQTK